MLSIENGSAWVPRHLLELMDTEDLMVRAVPDDTRRVMCGDAAELMGLRP